MDLYRFPNSHTGLLPELLFGQKGGQFTFFPGEAGARLSVHRKQTGKK
jgi:hypothetical protein